MSIEIEGDIIIIDGDLEIGLTFDNENLFFETDYFGGCLITKPELTQLIAALQAMHDKMVDV